MDQEFMLCHRSPGTLGSRPGNIPGSSFLLRACYRFFGFLGICVISSSSVLKADASDLANLMNRPVVTPEMVANEVAGFSFELTPQLQAPDAFLQRKRGDCADFANLASLVLTHQGYTTKLVVVMMSKQTHVVCFVKEAGGFLDYNHRADPHPVIASDGSLEDIARKVAGDFRSQWNMASVFRYQEKSPVFLDCLFASGSSPARSSKRRPSANAAVKTTPLAKTAGPLQTANNTSLAEIN